MPNMASCLLLYKLSCDVCQQLEAAQSAVYFIYHKIRQIGWHILVGVRANTLIAAQECGVDSSPRLKLQTQAPNASPSWKHHLLNFLGFLLVQNKILLLLSEQPYNN